MANDLDTPTYYSSSSDSDDRFSRDSERERVYFPRYAKVTTVIDGPIHLRITAAERAELTDNGSLLFVGGDLVWDARRLEWVTVEVVA